jgi:hypothetical protein
VAFKVAFKGFWFDGQEPPTRPACAHHSADLSAAGLSEWSGVGVVATLRLAIAA